VLHKYQSHDSALTSEVHLALHRVLRSATFVIDGSRFHTRSIPQRCFYFSRDCSSWYYIYSPPQLAPSCSFCAGTQLLPPHYPPLYPFLSDCLDSALLLSTLLFSVSYNYLQWSGSFIFITVVFILWVFCVHGNLAAVVMLVVLEYTSSWYYNARTLL
jgi:hypothetical protein